ncbi:MFS transporter [Paraburkholderia sp. J11-2]|uniref:MFS transporter n=1 Tax=Paraburkholderia sp. J11-2 TaxID=2805431 RepID=UPI002AB6B44A|nr:MFS transporter [Paraburkholderia sp. J11-2]
MWLANHASTPEKPKSVDPLSRMTSHLPSPALASRRLVRVVIATSFVSCLEIFNFTAFGLFAGWIGGQIFPSTNSMSSLLMAVGTFGVGFLFRPLGSIVIGAYADRSGRRAAMTLTIWLMAAGTAAIAACPSYSQVGIVAPVIMLLSRLVQGLAAGGEVGSAASYVMEASPFGRRNYLVSWQLVGQASSAILGASLGVVMSSSLSAANLAAWGWRVPFLIGLLIVPFGFYVRRRLPDDMVGRASPNRKLVPLAELSRSHGKTLALATLMIAGRTIPAYAIAFYMPSYLTHVMHWPAIAGFLASVVFGLVFMLFAPLTGLLADRLQNRKPLLLCAAGATTLLIFPVFHIITHAHDLTTVLAGVALISVFVAPLSSVGSVLVLESFPVQVRASGFSISYAFGVALFGGTVQLIITSLIKWTGNPMAAAWYAAPACLVSFIALLFFPERDREMAMKTH